MSTRIAKRLDGVSESATLRLNALVQTMKAQGKDVINLTAGEPDFAVRPEVKAAAKAAVDQDKSKYTPATGIPELRTLVAEKTSRQQPSVKPWAAADVVITNGGKQAIFNAMLALLDPGDEVLIPGPYWLSYPEMAKIAGGLPKIIAAPIAQGFRITAAQLKSSFTERSRILVLNSPSNPTGAVYSRQEFAEIGKILSEDPRARECFVISDEIYDEIILGDRPFCSFLDTAPQLRDRVITVNGLSKSAAMTGWRVGWSVAEAKITQAMATLQGQSTSGINALAQYASLAALRLPQSVLREQESVFRRRKELLLQILSKAAKLEVGKTEGAFYVFARVGKYFRPGEDATGFAERLLTEGQVAVVPGGPFGDSEAVRISFATDEKSLARGAERLVEYLGR